MSEASRSRGKGIEGDITSVYDSNLVYTLPLLHREDSITSLLDSALLSSQLTQLDSSISVAVQHSARRFLEGARNACRRTHVWNIR